MAETADPFSVQVIPNGVDTEFFIPADSKPRKTRVSYEFYSLAVFSSKKIFLFCSGKWRSFHPPRLNFTSLGTDLRNSALKDWHGS